MKIDTPGGLWTPSSLTQPIGTASITKPFGSFNTGTQILSPLKTDVFFCDQSVRAQLNRYLERINQIRQPFMVIYSPKESFAFLNSFAPPLQTVVLLTPQPNQQSLEPSTPTPITEPEVSDRRPQIQEVVYEPQQPMQQVIIRVMKGWLIPSEQNLMLNQAFLRANQPVEQMAWVMKTPTEAQILASHTPESLGYKKKERPVRKVMAKGVSKVLPWIIPTDHPEDSAELEALILPNGGLLLYNPFVWVGPDNDQPVDLKVVTKLSNGRWFEIFENKELEPIALEKKRQIRHIVEGVIQGHESRGATRLWVTGLPIHQVPMMPTPPTTSTQEQSRGSDASLPTTVTSLSWQTLVQSGKTTTSVSSPIPLNANPFVTPEKSLSEMTEANETASGVDESTASKTPEVKEWVIGEHVITPPKKP